MSSSFLEKFSGRLSVMARGGNEAPVSVVSAVTGKPVSPVRGSSSDSSASRFFSTNKSEFAVSTPFSSGAPKPLSLLNSEASMRNISREDNFASVPLAPSGSLRAPSPLDSNLVASAQLPTIHRKPNSSFGSNASRAPLADGTAASQVNGVAAPPTRLGLGALRSILSTEPPSSSRSTGSIPVGMGVGTGGLGISSFPPRPNAPPPEMPGSRDFVGTGRPHRVLPGNTLPPIDRASSGRDQRSVSPIAIDPSHHQLIVSRGSSSSSSSSGSSRSEGGIRNSRSGGSLTFSQPPTSQLSRFSTAQTALIPSTAPFMKKDIGDHRVDSSSSSLSALSNTSKASSNVFLEGDGIANVAMNARQDAVPYAQLGYGRSQSSIGNNHLNESSSGDSSGDKLVEEISDGAGFDASSASIEGQELFHSPGGSAEKGSQGDEPPTFSDEERGGKGRRGDDEEEDSMLYNSDKLDFSAAPVPTIDAVGRHSASARRETVSVPDYEPLSPTGARPPSPAFLLNSESVPKYVPDGKPPKLHTGSGRGGGALPSPAFLEQGREWRREEPFPKHKASRLKVSARPEFSSATSTMVNESARKLEDGQISLGGEEERGLGEAAPSKPRILSGKSVTYSIPPKVISPLSPTDPSFYSHVKSAVVASVSERKGSSSSSSMLSSGGFSGDGVGKGSTRGLGAGRLGVSLRRGPLPMLPHPGRAAHSAVTILHEHSRPGPGHARLPRSNEQLVKEESDKLLFSRKPRHVNYTPATVADFHRLKAQVEAGLSSKPSSLGPDWEKESRLQALDSRRKAGAYGAAVVKEAKLRNLAAAAEAAQESEKSPIDMYGEIGSGQQNPRPLPPGAELRKRIDEYSRTIPAPKPPRPLPLLPRQGDDEEMQTLGWSPAAHSVHVEGSTEPFALSQAMKDALNSVAKTKSVSAITAKAAASIGRGREGRVQPEKSFHDLIDMEIAHERARDDVAAIRRELLG